MKAKGHNSCGDQNIYYTNAGELSFKTFRPWRLRPNHLVPYSTIQDPIILSLTQPYKTWSFCILLNLTRPDHLVSFSTIQDHLVSYSTIQDPIILYLTQPYKTRSSCLLLISTCNYMLIVNMLEQSIWMIVYMTNILIQHSHYNIAYYQITIIIMGKLPILW